MVEWAVKRFWSSVEVVSAAEGFAVTLDTRPVKTPAKKPLVVSTKGLADHIAAEWAAQSEAIDPQTMPFTRTTNAAIDKVAPQFLEVVGHLSAYCGTDLLCYRAEGPAELVSRQNSAWDPLLSWSSEVLDAPLICAQGVMHVEQSPKTLRTYKDKLKNLSEFQLAAMHDLIGLSGSCVAAFALVNGVKSPNEIWRISRIDEDWQRDQWGADEEADALSATKKGEFLQAYKYFCAATRK